MTSALWLADWSDEEDAAFRAAAPPGTRVLRSAPLGGTVGSRGHRLRSYPAYAGLAVRGLRSADGDALVAWQPLVGALTGLLRTGARPPLVALNPILSRDSTSRAQRLAVAGLRRVDRVVVYTRAGLSDAVAAGLDPGRLAHVPLGVTARLDVAPPDP
ncbi:MAG: hypothetical protein JWN17_2319, partial [Frankiales bacterium]|nr:hypothetical protein [Frankiales bacterium]